MASFKEYVKSKINPAKVLNINIEDNVEQLEYIDFTLNMSAIDGLKLIYEALE